MSENRVPAQSPVFGLRVVNRDCLTPQGFSPKRLDAVYAGLTNSAHGHDMLMESASFDEVDSYYNPGEEEVSPEFIFEAIVVERFSQTERRMAAVVRVFNRFLSGSEIKALLPVVGKPRKTGAYAYVTVQLPFSDGQTVSVVFHSPEGDKKKIAPNDTIIAFQWLLNRRDITHVVAPENGSEIPLDELAKKITQLVVKNSVRFERMQKDAAEERKMLDDTRKAVDDAEDRQNDLMAAIASASSESETVDAKLSNTLSLLEKQKGINAELQAKLDALEKAQANGGGGAFENSDDLFDRMVKEAAKWRGAVMKAAKLVSHDKKKALALMNITTKGDLDAYLMNKFGVDASTARDVSNELTRKNIPDDMTAELSEYASEPWAQMALAQSSTPEDHYSDKVLSALVEMFGWTKSGSEFVQKDVGGGETGGALNPTGKRIVSANFDAERRRWISLLSGFDEILSVDGRPALSGKREDVMAVAREFDAQVMEWARKTAQGSPAENGESSLILELPITSFRPEEMRVMSEDGAYLVQTRRDGGEWITQKVHATEDAAIRDAQTWYPEQGETSDPELKRPDRQEEPFAAFLDGYTTTTANPYLLTSEKSDAFVLGRYFAQQGYERPQLAAKSRGDSWRVIMNSSEDTRAVEAVFIVNGETVKPKSGPSPRNDADTYSIGSLEKKIASLSSELIAKGIIVPSPAEFMADVDAGRRTGRSKAATAQKLKAHKADLAGLKSGTVTARKILGVGGKKEMAEAWLLLEIDACYTALEDGTGFHCTVNMGNYLALLKDALAGKNTTALTDEEVDEKQKQSSEEQQMNDAAYIELVNKANQMKNYSTGSLDAMKDPLEIKFTIQSDAVRTIVELGEIVTPQAKFEFLRDKAQSSPTLVKQDNIQFNRQVDLNEAMRKGIAFGHFQIEPRTGYCIATCTIDIRGAAEIAGGEVNIDNIPAIITTIATPFLNYSAPWIVMNAPRPIQGHETQSGEFIHGRLFAAIDTSRDDAAAMVEENRKLDAKIIESVDMDTAIKIGLSQIPDNYRASTEQMLSDADKTESAVSMVLDKIPSEVAYRKALELIQMARSMPSPRRAVEAPAQSQDEPSFTLTLRDILAGQYDSDTARMGSLLDEAAEEAEKAGTMEQYEDLFNQAADHLTAMLKKRAA